MTAFGFAHHGYLPYISLNNTKHELAALNTTLTVDAHITYYAAVVRCTFLVFQTETYTLYFVYVPP